MTESPRVVACVPRMLPHQHWDEAEKKAIEVNPSNRPPDLDEHRLQPNATGDRLALEVTRYWGRQGVDLTVGFIETPDRNLRDRILLHMNGWGRDANVRFVASDTDPQVRIARLTDAESPGDGGYWSNVGTDILLTPRDRPTMNLEAFTMNTPESEFVRVVRHEAGHTLGFPHEHMRRAVIERLDEELVIADFMRTQKWSRQEVIDQVLTPLEESVVIVTPWADETSIMCYHIDGRLTKDRCPVVGGTDINESDHAFAATVYPK